jgi:hypothetical protein
LGDLYKTRIKMEQTFGQKAGEFALAIAANVSGLVAGGGFETRPPVTSADINYCCSFTYKCLTGFRQPEQKINYVTKLNYFRQPPLATNPCYRQ